MSMTVSIRASNDGFRRTTPKGALAGAPLSQVRGVEQVLAEVAEPLAEVERELSLLVQSDVQRIPSVADYLRGSGGKRLRPALTGLGALAIDVPPSPKLMCVGELIHLGSLLHDDVVDEGELRRGKPAAQRVFGNPSAVLAGDFCLARAVWLAAEVGGHRAVSQLAQAVTEMAEGEVLQLEREGDLSCGRDAYFEVVNKKSAALIAWCCAAPAYSSEPAMAEALEVYGRGVGIAFQIADDILDYQDDTGKSKGVDLLQRKVTLPLLYALECLPELRNILEERELAREELELWISRVRQCGALDLAKQEAHAQIDASLRALKGVPRAEALAVLGRHLVERVC